MKMRMNYSVNLESEIYTEDIAKFTIKENDEFDYKRFIKDQKEKVYDGKCDEKSILLNEALLFLIDRISEFQDDKKSSEHFIDEIWRETESLNYSTFDSSKIFYIFLLIKRFKERFFKHNKENNEECLNPHVLNAYLALFGFNQSFAKHFELLKKAKMNYNEVKASMKQNELIQRWSEVMNFLRNNFPFEARITPGSAEKDEELSRSPFDPSKKGASRTVYKKPTTLMSQMKTNERKPRKSFNTANNNEK